ncbi:hypothetical protein, partial [Limosilactobacillus fermentum]|uniref:hypothetical protein n=1 Tax=Limosilactobacillus fermentum TaxID=1613 RepID=UPI003BA21BC9
KLVHGESLRILIGFLAISIIRGRLSLFQYPQGINLHKIFYTPLNIVVAIHALKAGTPPNSHILVGWSAQ